MSPHWRLALWYAAGVSVASVVISVAVGVIYGVPQALGFAYGVAVGLVSFTSTAATVSWLTGRNEALRGLAVASFAGRYLFVLAALGIPAVAGLAPVLAMVVGFAGVYVAENVMFLPGVSKRVSRLGKALSAVSSEARDEERRVEA